MKRLEDVRRADFGAGFTAGMRFAYGLTTAVTPVGEDVAAAVNAEWREHTRGDIPVPEDD